MMDEQLVQSQTIESLRRQLETSTTTARDAQALLRTNQEQQPQYGRMPPPTALPALTPGIISNSPLSIPSQPPQQDYGRESCTVQDITMWVHRQTQVMQKVCGPCSGETKWTPHDVTHLLLDRHHKGPVLSFLREQHGKHDSAKAFPHFQAAGSFLQEELIPGIRLIDVRFTLARQRSRSLQERLW